MRCSDGRERMARITDASRLPADTDLSAHLETCPACHEEWRRHRALLETLASPLPLPEFGDLAPAVLACLSGGRARRAYWQWAAAAAMALAAMALGFLFGSAGAGVSSAPQSMAATYQAAFTGQAATSPELAYLEAGQRGEAGVTIRSAP